MEPSNSVATNLDPASSSSPRDGAGTAGSLQLRAIRFLHSPISSVLEYSGLLRVRPDHSFSEALPLIPENANTGLNVQNPVVSPSINRNNDVDGAGNSNLVNSGNSGEISIRIIGEEDRVGNSSNDLNGFELGVDGSLGGSDDGNGNHSGSSSNDNNRASSSHQRYDIQQAARWIEQILPFSLLLLVVLIRQHLQGFVVVIYSTTILFKSNEILRKQTALKGERKITTLIGCSAFFMLHIFGIYWWHRKDDLVYPLIMIPPQSIPPFWHVVFIILINDTMARQAAMVVKLMLLMYYKNSRGHNIRRQSQMLTLVEYTLLLYRSLLPAPVWYRFFLNKEYGSIFSSLTTGLYLTFKLTSIVERVRCFFSSMKALSRKDIHYGTYATLEQVNAVGDLCAICQEKMQVPILLRCKHIFCEDCVSEWFERERTCPLCRALVRPGDLQSYGDGSTSLFFQLF